MPAACDPWAWDRFGPVKWLVVAGAALVGAVHVARVGTVRHQPHVTAAWLGFLGLSSIAACLASDPLLAFLGEGGRLYGVASLVLAFAAYLAGCAAGPGSLVVVVRALLAGAAVVVGYGLVQMAGWDPLDWRAGLDLSRARSTLGNAAFLGGYLALVLPVAALQWTNVDEPRRWRVVSAATFVGGVVVLAATETRSAWVGVAVGGVVAALLVRRLPASRDARKGRPLRLAALAVAVVGVAAAAGLLTPIGPRALSTLDPSTGTASGRLDTWANTIALVRERPVLGWGPEGFRTAFPHVVSRDWVATYGQEQVQDRAHNAFLDTAVTAGVLGASAYVALLAAAAIVARRAFRTGRREVVGVIAGLAAFVVHAQFLFDNFDLAVVCWVLVGVLAAESGIVATWRPQRRVARHAVVAVTAVALCWGVVGVVADRRVRSGIPGPPSRVVAALADASSLRPRVLEYHLLAGRVAIESGDEAALRGAHRLLRSWDDRDVRLADAGVLTRLGRVSGDHDLLAMAAAIYESTVAREPSSGLAWLGLGEARLRMGEGARARDAFAEAAVLLPRAPDAHLALGFLDLASGQVEPARQHLDAARRITPQDPRVAELARQLARR